MKVNKTKQGFSPVFISWIQKSCLCRMSAFSYAVEKSRKNCKCRRPKNITSCTLPCVNTALFFWSLSEEASTKPKKCALGGGGKLRGRTTPRFCLASQRISDDFLLENKILHCFFYQYMIPVKAFSLIA